MKNTTQDTRNSFTIGWSSPQRDQEALNIHRKEILMLLPSEALRIVFDFRCTGGHCPWLTPVCQTHVSRTLLEPKQAKSSDSEGRV